MDTHIPPSGDTHYKNRMDDTLWAFIQHCETFFPADAIRHSLDQQRGFYDAMVAAYRHARPDLVEVTERVVGRVPVRLYSAGDPTRTVLYCHGGGFVFGGLNSHDDICAELCAQTGYRVVAVDYRLAPEAQHPAQFEDAWAVAQWVSETYPGGIVLAGDSAGGTLCAAVAHYGRGRLSDILGQALIYPALGGDLSTPSYSEHKHAPMLTAEDMAYYHKIRCGGVEVIGDPTFLPLQDSDFANLPPTVLFSADLDPLRDDCLLYRERLQEAGVNVHWVNEEKLVHSYLRARHHVPRAAESFERISLAIEALGQEVWSFD